MVKILERATIILKAKFENFQGLFLKILSGVILNHPHPHSRNLTSCALIFTSILEILYTVPSFSPQNLGIFKGYPQKKNLENP